MFMILFLISKKGSWFKLEKMKRIILLSYLMFVANLLYAQKEMETQIKKDSTTQVKENDDYSNFNPDLGDNNLFKQKYFADQLQTTIVAIDNKIYRLNSFEYKKIKKTSAIPIIITDEKSSSGIKTIIIYKSINSN